MVSKQEVIGIVTANGELGEGEKIVTESVGIGEAGSGYGYCEECEDETR